MRECDKKAGNRTLTPRQSYKEVGVTGRWVGWETDACRRVALHRYKRTGGVADTRRQSFPRYFHPISTLQPRTPCAYTHATIRSLNPIEVLSRVGGAQSETHTGFNLRSDSRRAYLGLP